MRKFSPHFKADMDDHKLIFQQLTSTKKLERDRGLLDLQKHLETIDPETYIALTDFIVERSESSVGFALLSHDDSSGLNIDDEHKSEPITAMETDSLSSHWECNHALLTVFKVSEFQCWVS